MYLFFFLYKRHVTTFDGLRFRSLISVLGWILIINKNICPAYTLPAEHFKKSPSTVKKRSKSNSIKKLLYFSTQVHVSDFSINRFYKKKYLFIHTLLLNVVYLGHHIGFGHECQVINRMDQTKPIYHVVFGYRPKKE